MTLVDGRDGNGQACFRDNDLIKKGHYPRL